jgi:NTP pyrophosphatase (non-canonical NTP hydrolase)
MPTMNKWEVTTDPLTLRRLGKLGEELGELANVASRCIIQGINATDPGTGKVNRQRLLDELADVAAQIDCTMTAFGLDASYFGERRTKKRAQMAEWEALYQPTLAGGKLEPVHPNHRPDLRYVLDTLCMVKPVLKNDPLRQQVEASINGMGYIIRRTEEAAPLGLSADQQEQSRGGEG